MNMRDRLLKAVEVLQEHRSLDSEIYTVPPERFLLNFLQNV